MLTSLLMITACVTGQAAADVDTDLQQQVRRLVRQLDAASLAEREAAEEALVELGPPILGLLPRDDDRISAEVRQRAGRIRLVLQKKLAEEAIRASTVTLHRDDMPLPAILGAIEEQTGNKIVADGIGWPADPNAAPKLDVDFDEMPFWMALDYVLNQANLSISTFGPERAVHLARRGRRPEPPSDTVSYNGPFRFEATLIEAVRDLRNPANEALKVTLELSWEPRLEPISFQQPRDTLKAVDENGSPLPVDLPGAYPELPVMPSMTSTEVVIPLALPPRDVRRIGSLQGTFVALVAGKKETFRFENPAEAKQQRQRIAGATVVLEQARKNDDLWEIRISVTFEQTGDALASHYNWMLENEALLVPSEGDPMTPVALDTTRRSETEIGLSYLFAIDGEMADHVFVYKTPATIHSREFDFEIKDILLP